MMKFLRTQMKWIMAIIVVAFLLSTFFMYEGRGTRRTPGRNPDGSISDYEVAQINGRSLMRSELEQRLRNYLSNYSSRSAESLDMPAIYQAVLDQAILESQMTKELEESGIRVSDAEAEQAMKNYADTYFPTRETFYQALANSGVRVEDYKRSLARQIATEQLLRTAIGEVVISEDRATEFYDTMKNLIYSRPEGFMVHMADFSTEKDAEEFRAKLAAGDEWTVLASGDTSSAVNMAIGEMIQTLVDGIRNVLEQTPPELSADIIDRGIVLTGGGALLRGLPELIAQQTGINCFTADNPMESVALGTGKALAEMDKLSASGKSSMLVNLKRSSRKRY